MSIAELLKADEGKTLEFKQDISSPRNLLRTLVAFANTAGGRIIIGVADKTRKPLGIDNPLDEEERLCNLIADSISPRLAPNVEMTTVSGKNPARHRGIPEQFPASLSPFRRTGNRCLCQTWFHQPTGRPRTHRRTAALGGGGLV